MPINFTDFSNIKPITMGNLAEPYMEGRNFSEQLKKNALERTLIGLQNQNLQTANEFQRPQLEQGLKKGEADLLYQELVNKFLPEEKTSEIGYRNAHTGLTRQQIIEKQIENELNRKYGEESKLAEMAWRRRAGLSTQAADAEALYGSGTPEFKKALSSIVGEMTGAQGQGTTPDYFRSLAGKSASERNNVFKQQRADMVKVDSAKKAYETLNKMENLVKKHPDLHKYLATVITNPGEKSLINKVVTYGMNEKERTALELMTKYSNQLALDVTATWGKNATDARAKMIELSKAAAGLTGDANQAIIGTMKEELFPVIAYGKDLKNAYQNGYEVIFDRDNYPKNETEAEEIKKNEFMRQELSNRQPTQNPQPAASGQPRIGQPIGQSVANPQESAEQLRNYAAQKKAEGKVTVLLRERPLFVPYQELKAFMKKYPEARIYE